VVNGIDIAHISDIHFGGRADFPQLAVLERFLPTLRPGLIVVSGDLTQRCRHGELQAARRYLDGLAATAPVHVVPGNHDVTWWRSPFHVVGRRAMHAKWRRYFGEDLTPVLELDGVIVAGLLSANGLAPASLTWNPNDLTVRGDLPSSEVARVRGIFAKAPPEKARVVVVHHNVVPGVISQRWGVSHPRAAQTALLTLDADVVLCGHDHTEGAGQIHGRLPVSTAGTHSLRTRGGRPSAFNVVRLRTDEVRIEHFLYDRNAGTFRPGDQARFARYRVAAQSVV
jgi:3',5'-cyclic AMP phosphodiesterase CpdA